MFLVPDRDLRLHLVLQLDLHLCILFNVIFFLLFDGDPELVSCRPVKGAHLLGERVALLSNGLAESQ